jgi:hypothetical protein
MTMVIPGAPILRGQVRAALRVLGVEPDAAGFECGRNTIEVAYGNGVYSTHPVVDQDPTPDRAPRVLVVNVEGWDRRDVETLRATVSAYVAARDPDGGDDAPF